MPRRRASRPASTRPPSFDPYRARRAADADATLHAKSVTARQARTRALERLFAPVADSLTTAAIEMRRAAAVPDLPAYFRASNKIMAILTPLSTALKDRVHLCKNYHCPRIYFLAGSRTRGSFCSLACRQAAHRARSRVTQ